MITAYHQPTRLDEALRLVATGATPVAGATGLWTAKKRPKGDVVDITGLGLDGIEVHEDHIALGATVTLTQIARAAQLPGVEGELLRCGAALVTSRPMRNVITLGGNIAHVAYWEDMPVVLLALDATLLIRRDGEAATEVSLADALQAGKQVWRGGLITGVKVPRQAGRRGFGHQRFARVSNDFPLVTACAVLRREGEVARDVHVVMGALQPRAFRVAEVEALLDGATLDARLLRKAQAMMQEGVPVGPNFRASPAYRREVAGVLTRRVLQAAWAATEEG